MYRRFQNPIVQGTAVMPNAMQAPPVVRVSGVQEGSLAAAILTQQHAPWINGFIRAQRQGQEVGGLNVVSVMRDLPDFRITYTRQFGQEYISVQFRPAAVERAERPEEIELDLMFDGYIAFDLLTQFGETATADLYINDKFVATMRTSSRFDGAGWVPQSYVLFFGDGDRFESILDPDNRGAYLAPMREVLTVAPPRGDSVSEINVGGSDLVDAKGNKFFATGYSKFWYSGVMRAAQASDAVTVLRVPTSTLDVQGLNRIEFRNLNVTFTGGGVNDLDWPQMMITVISEFYTRDPRLLRVAQKSWRSDGEEPRLINDWRVLYTNTIFGVLQLSAFGNEYDYTRAWVWLNLSPELPGKDISFCQLQRWQYNLVNGEHQV